MTLRSGKFVGAFLAVALLAGSSARAGQLVDFYSDSSSNPILLSNGSLFSGIQVISVAFAGVGSAATPIQTETGNIEKFGTVLWGSAGNSPSGSDSANFDLTTHQTVPSAGSGDFSGVLDATFKKHSDDTLSATFTTTLLDLGGITYQLGYKDDSNSFVAFHLNQEYTIADFKSNLTGGAFNLYVQLGGQINPQAVPEPSTLALGGLAVVIGAGLGLRRRRVA